MYRLNLMLAGLAVAALIGYATVPDSNPGAAVGDDQARLVTGGTISVPHTARGLNTTTTVCGGAHYPSGGNCGTWESTDAGCVGQYCLTTPSYCSQRSTNTGAELCGSPNDAGCAGL